MPVAQILTVNNHGGMGNHRLYSAKNRSLFTLTFSVSDNFQLEEDFDEIEDDAEVDAEDPRVIKELIDLIKKVGKF